MIESAQHGRLRTTNTARECSTELMMRDSGYQLMKLGKVEWWSVYEDDMRRSKNLRSRGEEWDTMNAVGGREIKRNTHKFKRVFHFLIDASMLFMNQRSLRGRTRSIFWVKKFVMGRPTAVVSQPISKISINTLANRDRKWWNIDSQLHRRYVPLTV